MFRPRSLARAALAALLAASAAAPATLANGLGDLYVGVAGGVVETRTDTAEVIEEVPVTGPASGLAFWPDAKKLLVSTGGPAVIRIDIESISADGVRTLTHDASLIVHPAGTTMVAAGGGGASLTLVDDATGTTRAVALPGVPDRLAADSRAKTVLAASSAASWLAIVDPAAASVRRLDLSGAVTAMAIAADGRTVYAATEGPDQLVRVDLKSAELAPEWTSPLPGVATTVAAVTGGAVAAIEDGLWLVAADAGPAPLATLPEAPTALAPTSDGDFVVAGVPGHVLVYDLGGAKRSDIAMPGKTPLALAPVPGKNAIGDPAKNGGPSASPDGPTAKPKPTRLPPSLAEQARTGGMRPTDGGFGLLLMAAGASGTLGLGIALLALRPGRKRSS